MNFTTMALLCCYEGDVTGIRIAHDFHIEGLVWLYIEHKK